MQPTLNMVQIKNMEGQPTGYTETREVRTVPQSNVQEVRRVENVATAAPVATSQVHRVDQTAVGQSEHIQ